ncbi:MAG: RagB/SusD family nutrient uptake outer membrane protein [Dysgonamonadaceae bacterium]|jgi:hypothetical protein|nr:RagB/SusD family nutrient uptake outer membrane protein [Dysgonamonadaceae bacterium]
MKRFIILTIIALTVGFSACDDLLDTKPLDKISEKDYFKTEGDLQLFSNPFYNNLLNKSPFNEQSDLLVQLTLSDILQGGNKRTVPNSGGGWTWTDLRRMNTLIKYAPQCPDEAAVTKYTALTKFFRAYFYFEKIKRFGDVPWYETELGSADEELYNPRDSRELIMTKMIEDIDEAIANLPSAISLYRANKWAALALKSRFCLYEGTYRKYHGVSLEGHDYKYYLELSAAAAKELIDNSPYKLYTTGNPDKDYLTLFAQENASTDEYIMAIKFDFGLGIYHNATAYTLVPTQGRPGYTKNMIDMYLMSDGTAFTDQPGWESMSFTDEVKNRDPRLAQSIRTPGYKRIGNTEVLAPDLGVAVTGYQPIKFVQDPTASGGNVDRNDRSTCDLPVYRYAEALLNYAEAKAELGSLSQNDLDISVNKIRTRAGMPNLSTGVAADRYLKEIYPNVSSGIILEIRRERMVELMQEGFRFNDLVRWKAGACLDRNLIGMYFPGPGSYDLSGDGNTDLILYDGAKPSAPAGVQVYKIGEEIILTNGNKGNLDFHQNVERTKFNEVRDYLYPIPINERSLNKALTQNPGWNDGLNF